MFIYLVPRMFTNLIRRPAILSNVCSINTTATRFEPKKSKALSKRKYKEAYSKPKEVIDQQTPFSHLFHPVVVNEEIKDDGAEQLTGELDKTKLSKVLSSFLVDSIINELAQEEGVDDNIITEVNRSFKNYCLDKKVPAELHIRLYDIINGSSHYHELYNFYIEHAQKVFPHLKCMKELFKISDLSEPSKWYPEARAVNRKIIFHAGPTNSGKTYHAMQCLMEAESGVYCSPLKLLAVEVFQKCNSNGTPCDLLIGEEIKFAVSPEEPSSHVACTVEMTNITHVRDVAVLDEIQMIKDPQRGWAWTRALLGLPAKELHVCGEASAIELIREFAEMCNDEFEVREYNRKTKLIVEKQALENLNNVMPGDCIVCFNKQHIHKAAKDIKANGQEFSMIYGALPPGAKASQAEKFNNQDNKCTIMIATDAIGMGINLSIKRIIFYSLNKPNMNQDGDVARDVISCSQALQIAGRAGRYGTAYETGYVTTLAPSELNTLKRLLKEQPPLIEQAGLRPTADQIELFAYYLPTYSLSLLVDIFCRLCKLDSSKYFMCTMQDFKFISSILESIPLDLRTRYVYCTSPVSEKQLYVTGMIQKFARKHANYEPISLEWICKEVKWPLPTAKNLSELVHLEEVFDLFDLYQWLGIRFPDIYTDCETLRELQRNLDKLIDECVDNIFKIISKTLRANKESYTRRISKDMPKQTNIFQTKISQELLSKGVLTPEDLRKLAKEISNKPSGKDTRAKNPMKR